MRITKKSSHWLVLLLITITTNSYAMETPTWVEKPTFSGYIQYIAELLLGNVRFRQDESLPLRQLPPESQSTIVSFLLINNNAQSITIVGKTINSLAQVNKELNELINDPEFCLQLIKHLAQRFNCSDESAAMALQTQEAYNRLHVQKTFEQMIRTDKFNKKSFDIYYKEYKHYLDLNFTYKYFYNTDYKYTPLLYAAELQYVSNLHANDSNKDQTDKIKWLLNTNTIDINYTNIFGATALTLAVTTNPQIIQLLCNYPGINVNQTTDNGSTALLILCENSISKTFNPQSIRILLDAGADPEIANNAGTTPLKIVEQYENLDAIYMIRRAIAKKHSKK